MVFASLTLPLPSTPPLLPLSSPSSSIPSLPPPSGSCCAQGDLAKSLGVYRHAFIHGCCAIAATAAASSLFSTAQAVAAAAAAEAPEDIFQDWYRFQGDGFALSIPPDFQDIREAEDYMSGVSMYGDKAKPKTFAARFASPERSEVLSVVIRKSAELKLSFFAVKDVTDLGSLQDAASIFVPVGAKVYAARTIKPSDEETDRTYYYYEFATGDNYVAMQAAASNGKVYVLGVTAPKKVWKDDYKKLRLAAASFSLY